MKNNFLEKAKEYGIQVKVNEELRRYTTLNIGGKAKYFVNVFDIDQLITVLMLTKRFFEKILVIGAGSNMLISDEGFDGVVVKLRGDFNRFEINENEIVSYSAVMLPMLINAAVENSLSGLEDLFGIPGTVAGAVFMNAGVKTATISDNLVYIEGIKIDDPQEVVKLKRNDINFSYRKSNLDGYIITKAVFSLKKGDSTFLKERITEILIKRNETQPLGTFNAGCIFKNPDNGKISSAKLIEECGLKGYSCGGAYISEKHANFIINRNNASSKDFVDIIKYVIKVVEEKYKIKLEPEIKLIGLEI
ncbi:MAG: UDP-N-acetylmuramate dehydrogenase [Endomicrobia bacterium]|nr:UDP-N-acetylmuramate dehydrogenase [Endomicrobiia bacterium]